jgi:SRSO17 transposase
MLFPMVIRDSAAEAEEQSDRRFLAFIDTLMPVLTHPAQEDSLRAYCTGLCLENGRKSMEPIAANLAPKRTQAAHEALQNFITDAPWSADALLDSVREYTLPHMIAQAPIQAWIIDDTGMPKKGKHSVGVAHQYCGQLGKQANCQVAVTLSVANEDASLPIAYRLYLPKEWADDQERRKRAGVPDDIMFATKQNIALEQIRTARAAGVPNGVLLADAGYGNDSTFRDSLTALDIPYAVGVSNDMTAWPPGITPLPPKKWNGRGRRPTNLRRNARRKPLSVKKIAMSLPAEAYKTVKWREGTSKELSSRFAAVRVRAAQKETKKQRSEEWLIIEWPENEKEPTKYILSTLSDSMDLAELVRIAHLRWRIERDFQELKDELGLNHFEGRKWRGFHHHAALCIATYGFLVAERSRFSPSGRCSVSSTELSANHRSCQSSDHHGAPQSSVITLAKTSSGISNRQTLGAVSMLQAPKPTRNKRSSKRTIAETQ